MSKQEKNNDSEYEYNINIEDSNESYSVHDAALAWLSSGKDEDYMFGYTEEELEDALRED